MAKVGRMSKCWTLFWLYNLENWNEKFRVVKMNKDGIYEPVSLLSKTNLFDI